MDSAAGDPGARNMETKEDDRTKRSPQGISNRESPAEEAEERRQFRPKGTSAPTDEDAATQKTGTRSTAQKTDESRYPDRSMPATHKVDGASGREPEEE
jgi:hypothetical protein